MSYNWENLFIRIPFRTAAVLYMCFRTWQKLRNISEKRHEWIQPCFAESSSSSVELGGLWIWFSAGAQIFVLCFLGGDQILSLRSVWYHWKGNKQVFGMVIKLLSKNSPKYYIYRNIDNMVKILSVLKLKSQQLRLLHPFFIDFRQHLTDLCPSLIVSQSQCDDKSIHRTACLTVKLWYEHNVTTVP